MRPPLDTLLTQAPPPNDAARQRALDAARAELALRRPVRRWRTQALGLFAVSAFLTSAVAGVMFGLGRTSGALLLGRLPLLALLWACCAVGAWGALAPRTRWLPLGAAGLALGTGAALVLSRGSALAPSSLPDWFCTLSHVGVDLVPLAVGVMLLRGAAFRASRALVAGLSAGAVGAFVGELACLQDARHVLVYHLPAWALVALVSFGVSRFLSPRSFAP